MINTKSSLRKILKENHAECFGKFLMYSKSPLFNLLYLSSSPSLISASAKSQSMTGIKLGLGKVIEAANSGRDFMINLYSDEEIAKDPEKKDVVLFHFPVDKRSPYIVVCAGGGYQVVSSLSEAFPVTARFNELGYNVFVLNYTVGKDKVLPKPIDDLARAISYIEENSEKLNVEKGVYAVNGYSSGANLVCLWGSDNYGYSKYGLPKPKALFPIYPDTGSVLLHDPKMRKYVNIMCGKNASQEYIDSFDIRNHLEGYPPCYIVACKDDNLTPYQESTIFCEVLTEKGIKHVLELGETGGHAFGEGTGTEVEGWYERAIEFFESV